MPSQTCPPPPLQQRDTTVPSCWHASFCHLVAVYGTNKHPAGRNFHTLPPDKCGDFSTWSNNSKSHESPGFPKTGSSGEDPCCAPNPSPASCFCSLPPSLRMEPPGGGHKLGARYVPTILLRAPGHPSLGPVLAAPLPGLCLFRRSHKH